MSETIKQSNELGGEEKGWREVEAMSGNMPKHMRQGVPVEEGNDGYQPKHMRKVEAEPEVEPIEDVEPRSKVKLSEKDRARLEAWQATIQQLREERGRSETSDTLKEESSLEKEKKDPFYRAKKDAVRPEDLGMTAREMIEEQPGLMIVQDIQDGNSEFWVKSADRGGEPSKTTLNRELEQYREQIVSAKNAVELSKATRIENNVRFALGGNEEVMEQFEKVAEETGYREKQEQFSGDPAKFEKRSVEVAVKDISRQIGDAEKELAEIEGSLRNYRGLRGLFGEGRREKSQLRWQRDQMRRRLERMRGDLAQLERRNQALGLGEAKGGGAELKIVQGGKESNGSDGSGELKKAA